MIRLSSNFFTRDVLIVAPELLGKIIVINDNRGIREYLITETEAYRGTEDLACHACKGRTPRTEAMYDSGGKIYVYLIYGMYWMLNFVTGEKDHPQAALIRSIEGFNGPGKLTRQLQIDKSFYGENLCTSDRIWVAEKGNHVDYITTKRIGIDYAGEKWNNQPWRFVLKSIL